jgi:hypothetical protein
MQAELTSQFPDPPQSVEVQEDKATEIQIHPYPTNSQRASKNPLTSPADTVEADLMRLGLILV